MAENPTIISDAEMNRMLSSQNTSAAPDMLTDEQMTVKLGHNDKTGMSTFGLGNRKVTVAPDFGEKLMLANADMVKATGYPIVVNSSYRTKEKQQELYDELKPKGAKVATPGTSRHEKGLAVDIGNWREAASFLKKYGIENPFPDDRNHFQFAAGIKAPGEQQGQPAKMGDTTFPAGVRQARPEEIKPLSREKIGEDIRPYSKGGGALAGGFLGGIAGGTAGAAASAPTVGMASPLTVPAGAFIGRTIGSGLGDEAGDWIADKIAGKPHGWKDASKNVQEGMGWNIVGEGAGAGISAIAKASGKVLKPIIGRLTGKGTESVEQALESGTSTGLLKSNPLKSNTDFDKALRGDISGEEIVNNAHGALKNIRDKRGAEYLAKLNQIKADPAALSQVRAGLDQELARAMGPDRFQIGMNQTPRGIQIDFSQSPLVINKEVLKKAIKDVVTWQDNSAAGLDILKRRLGTYADQVERGSPPQAFLTRLKNNVSDGLKANVPEYAEMAKGYSEATDLIKDIESDLMMRKQGMSGRITADQTLRRLTSAMKDNFELRKDLVEELGKGSSMNLSGQIAGHAMSPILPSGLVGSGVGFGGGMLMLGHYLNPHYWPLIAASSPRAMGEFLRIFGKGMAEAQKAKPALKLIGPVGVAATTKKKPEAPKEELWREIGGEQD